MLGPTAAVMNVRRVHCLQLWQASLRNAVAVAVAGAVIVGPACNSYVLFNQTLAANEQCDGKRI